jgi:esterase/lipase superfamily enzyme
MLKYSHEIDSERALAVAQQMREVLKATADCAHILDDELDVPTYMAAWEHLSAPERAAWKTMAYLGKTYAGQ